MKIKASWNDSELIIAFSGELDESNAKLARNKCDEYIDKYCLDKCIFDFRELSFMDSTGIGVILGRYKLLKSNKRVLIIANPCKQVMKIIKTSGMDRIIRII